MEDFGKEQVGLWSRGGGFGGENTGGKVTGMGRRQGEGVEVQVNWEGVSRKGLGRCEMVAWNGIAMDV